MSLLSSLNLATIPYTVQCQPHTKHSKLLLQLVYYFDHYPSYLFTSSSVVMTINISVPTLTVESTAHLLWWYQFKWFKCVNLAAHASHLSVTAETSLSLSPQPLPLISHCLIGRPHIRSCRVQQSTQAELHSHHKQGMSVCDFQRLSFSNYFKRLRRLTTKYQALICPTRTSTMPTPLRFPLSMIGCSKNG